MKRQEQLNKPFFFLVGAPKSGTTALASYLSEHQDIGFSYFKEPNFFNDDFSGSLRYFTDQEKYLQHCYPDYKDKKVLGEGTVLYLYSKHAIPNILRFKPDAKFIVMLRNPIEIAVSWHSHHLRWKINEDVEDFKKAWALQEERKKGRHLPAECKDPKLLQYRDIALLGEQLSRLYELVDKKQVKLIFFDDFKKDPKSEYESTLQFLNVMSDNRTEFPVINANMHYKSRWIARYLKRFNTKFRRLAVIKQRIGIPQKYSISRVLNQMNSLRAKRQQLDPEFQKKLIEEFRDDIILLEKLADQDLSDWLKVKQ